MFVDDGFAGRTIDLAVGQVMELRLAENPTTGFRWNFVSTGAPSCVVVDDTFQTPGGPPGQGGMREWRIEGMQPGECDIALHYRRSFEQSPPSRSFTLHVGVGRND
jgi:inhibitor of cysteine peptidase